MQLNAEYLYSKVYGGYVKESGKKDRSFFMPTHMESHKRGRTMPRIKKRNRPDYDGYERGIFTRNKAILRKTATVCALCGLPLNKQAKYPDPMSTSIDHKIPVALGGKSTLDNLQATHLICNKRKGKKIVFELNTKQRQKELSQENVIDVSSIPQYVDWSNYKVEDC